MGDDSINQERSLWIRNIIADIMLDECRCHLYNLGALAETGNSCLRCDNLRRAARLWPIQHQQAVNNITKWGNFNGIQPG